MKKLIVFIFVIALACPAFAEDTVLGNFQLTDKQISQTETLKSEVIKGFSYWTEDGKLVVTSIRPLSKEEKNALVASVSQLPNQDTQAVADAKAKAEVDALIDQKIAEIAVIELKKEGKLDVSGEIVRETV